MEYNRDQVLCTLAYVSYVGLAQAGSTKRSARVILEEMRAALDLLPAVRGGWKVIWGPGLFKFHHTLFYDNMMFVVESRSDPADVVVVIRGTSLLSLSNLLVEDLNVRRLVPWQSGAPAPGTRPRISLGTSLGLTALQHMKPPAGVPGAGAGLLDLLAETVREVDAPMVTVTGHSLGGTLASTLGLWLRDLQGTDTAGSGWDPQEKARLEVFSLAGLTAGNADFAAYSNRTLASACRRIWNSKDIVPHFWNEDSLATVPDLYAPLIEPSGLERAAFILARAAVEGRGYTQVEAGAPPLEGAVRTDWGSFSKQAFYQHALGYPALLGMPWFDIQKLLEGKLSDAADATPP